jgi:hypothetical protein
VAQRDGTSAGATFGEVAWTEAVDRKGNVAPAFEPVGPARIGRIEAGAAVKDNRRKVRAPIGPRQIGGRPDLVPDRGIITPSAPPSPPIARLMALSDIEPLRIDDASLRHVSLRRLQNARRYAIVEPRRRANLGGTWLCWHGLHGLPGHEAPSVIRTICSSPNGLF